MNSTVLDLLKYKVSFILTCTTLFVCRAHANHDDSVIVVYDTFSMTVINLFNFLKVFTRNR